MSTINQAFDSIQSVYSDEIRDTPDHRRNSSLYTNNDQNNGVEQMKMYVQEGEVRHVTPVDTYEMTLNQLLAAAGGNNGGGSPSDGEGACGTIDGGNHCATTYGLSFVHNIFDYQTPFDTGIPSGRYIKLQLSKMEFFEDCFTSITSPMADPHTSHGGQDPDRDFSVWIGVTTFLVCDHEGNDEEIHVLDAMRIHHVVNVAGEYRDALLHHIATQDCCIRTPIPPDTDHQCTPN